LFIVEETITGEAVFGVRTAARIDELRSKAGCVFLVSHSLTTIREMTNRCIWIEKGELVMDDDPAVVTKKYHGYTKLMANKQYKQSAKYLEEVKSGYVPKHISWSAQR